MLLVPTIRTLRAAFFLEASFAKGEVLRILNSAVGAAKAAWRWSN